MLMNSIKVCSNFVLNTRSSGSWCARLVPAISRRRPFGVVDKGGGFCARLCQLHRGMCCLMNTYIFAKIHISHVHKTEWAHTKNYLCNNGLVLAKQNCSVIHRIKTTDDCVAYRRHYDISRRCSTQTCPHHTAITVSFECRIICRVEAVHNLYAGTIEGLQTVSYVFCVLWYVFIKGHRWGLYIFKALMSFLINIIQHSIRNQCNYQVKVMQL